MHEITLSIIIPVYNTSDYLDRCILSLLEQYEDRIEIILIDDGSTDKSGFICDEYSEKYSFIKTVHKKNGGLASARNEGIHISSGEYLCFLDSDDWLGRGALNSFLSIINSYKPDLIGFGYQKTTCNKVFYKYHQRWKEGTHSGGSLLSIKRDSINDNKLFEFGIIRSVCMHVFKKQIIDMLNLEFISERIVLNEDYLFFVSFILNASSYYCCKDYYYNYFYRKNSLTTTYLTNMFDRKNELLSQYKKRIKEATYDDSETEYRLNLFYLDNCYECLANECSIISPNKIIVQRILDDINSQDVISSIRISEQSIKARIFLKLMEYQKASTYIAFYRLFGILKRIKWSIRGKYN